MRALAGAAVLIAVAAWSPANAYEVSEPGLDSILRGDFKGGTAELESAAKAGDARAAFLLFGMHFRGYHVPRDLEKARRWLAMSERNPISESLYVYGYGHYTGTALPKDAKKAFDLFRRASDKGHSSARFYLGKMYLEGIGTAKDPVKGLALMKRSADAGSAHALYYLAGYYNAKGRRDAKKRLSYLRRAARAGLRKPQEELYHIYVKGIDVRPSRYRAFIWGRAAARQGTPSLYYPLARMYHQGRGTKRDYPKAAQWYRLAAGDANADAAYRLAGLHRYGVKKGKKVLFKVDMAQAYKWYGVAAKLGMKKAEAPRDATARSLKFLQLALIKREIKRWRPGRAMKDLRLRSGGTGVFVNFSHWVVTNEHVIAGCTRVAVRYKGKLWDRVKIIGARKNVDLALLEVEVPVGRRLTHGVAAIAPPDDAPLGEQVAVYGYPWSNVLSPSGVFTLGILNAHVGIKNNKNFIQISAPIQPGNSGSAVYDERGRVMGIVSSTLESYKRPAQNVNFAVKGSVLSKMIDAFHTPNYSFDEKNSPTITVKERARVGQRNSVHIQCYHPR
jgi:TPR repeat protein